MSALLPVEQAQERLLALRAPLSSENIALSESLGRYLSNDVVAERDQPAAPLSALPSKVPRPVEQACSVNSSNRTSSGRQIFIAIRATAAPGSGERFVEGRQQLLRPLAVLGDGRLTFGDPGALGQGILYQQLMGCQPAPGCGKHALDLGF